MSCFAIISLVFGSVVFALRFAILFLKIGVNLGRSQNHMEYLEQPEWVQRLPGQKPGDI